MSKRKLTHNQQRRIKQNQDDSDSLNGLVGLVVSHHGKKVDIEDDQQQIIKCKLRQNLPALAVGDHVLYQIEDTQAKPVGVVIKLLDRHSLLVRANTAAQTTRPIAANLDQMFIIFTFEPEPQSLLIDQFLITAHVCDITPILVFNKLDLFQKLNPNDPQDQTKIDQINNLLKIYQAIGYPILQTSSFDSTSMQALEKLLADKTSLLIGASGVGKSTLSQYLLPNAVIKTGEINDRSKLGKHTTSSSKLYHLNNGGKIIDAPGIRELDVGHIAREQLESAYPEFAPLLKKCKFRDCSHEHEPDCAFKQALDDGLIHPVRWENYKRLRSL